MSVQAELIESPCSVRAAVGWQQTSTILAGDGENRVRLVGCCALLKGLFGVGKSSCYLLLV